MCESPWAVEAVRLIETGLEPVRCAVACGASDDEAQRWVKDPENQKIIRDAEAHAEIALLEVAKVAGGAGARWLLERRFPERYGPGVARRAKPKNAIGRGEVCELSESALARAERRRKRGRLSLVASDE